MRHQPPRLFFDVSYVARSTANTGIHRVVRHLLREMIDRPEWCVIPFCAADTGTRLLSRREVIDKIFAPFDLLRGDEKVSDAPSRTIDRWTHSLRSKLFNTFIPRARRLVASLLPVKAWNHFILGSKVQPGSLARWVFLLYCRFGGVHSERGPLVFCEPLSKHDSVLLVDATWHVMRMGELLADIHRQGATITTVVHDVIPLQYASLVHPGLVEAFAPWFEAVARFSERIVCFSQAEMENVRQVLVARGFSGLAMRLTHVTLGAVPFTQADRKNHLSRRAKQQIAHLAQLPSPCFLMVGTIEPRKNHAMVLNAFRKFLEAGGVGSLLVIGAPGWNTSEAQNQFVQLPRKGLPVLWLKNADDVVLEAAYRHASCVIQASLCEGFGLPVIESMLRNKQLVCSDIPVFREIAGTYPFAYFRTDDPAALTSIMHQIAANPAPTPRPASLMRDSASNSWAAVAQAMSTILCTNAHRKWSD